MLLSAFAGASVTQTGWRQLTSTTAPGGFNPELVVYDSHADRFILVGFSPSGRETWSFDLTNNTWSNLTTADSPALAGATVVYDSSNDRMFLHGGYRYNVGLTNETWSYDYGTKTWLNLSSSGKPPRVLSAAMAYDPLANRILLFGGDRGGTTYMNETWIYDPANNTWTELRPSVSPPADYAASMVFDSRLDRFMLYGGQTYNVTGCPNPDCFAWATNGLWSFDLTTQAWQELTSGPPLARYASIAGVPPQLVYDAGSGQTLVVGLWNWSNPSHGAFWNASWTFDPVTNAWTNVTAAPPGLESAPWGKAAYDEALGCPVLLIGTGVWGYGCPLDSSPPGVSLWIVAFGAAGVLGVGAVAVLVVRRKRRQTFP